MKDRDKAKGYNKKYRNIVIEAYGSVENAAEVFGISPRQLYRNLAKPSKEELRNRKLCDICPDLTLETIYNIDNSEETDRTKSKI